MGWAGTKSRWGCSGLSPGKECSFPSWPGTPIPVLKYPWRQGKGFLMFSYKFLVAACDRGSTHRSSKLLVHGSYPPVDLSWFQTSAASLYWGGLLITWQLQDIHKNTAIPSIQPFRNRAMNVKHGHSFLQRHILFWSWQREARARIWLSAQTLSPRQTSQCGGEPEKSSGAKRIKLCKWIWMNEVLKVSV